MDYIKNHGNVKKLFKGSWNQPYGCGYYAFVELDGQLVIGEERGREGGDLYCGEYKGEETPYLADIKKENERLYNNIVRYFRDHEKSSMTTQDIIIKVPYWCEIGTYIEWYDPVATGIKGWVRERIVAFGYDGFFHQANNCPMYFTKFSEYGKTVRPVQPN